MVVMSLLLQITSSFIFSQLKLLVPTNAPSLLLNKSVWVTKTSVSAMQIVLVHKCRYAWGNVVPPGVRAPRTVKFLQGRPGSSTYSPTRASVTMICCCPTERYFTDVWILICLPWQNLSPPTRDIAKFITSILGQSNAGCSAACHPPDI